MLLSLDWTLQLPLAVGYLLVVLVSLCLVAGSDGGQSLPLGRLGIFLFVDHTPSLLDRSVEARSGVDMDLASCSLVSPTWMGVGDLLWAWTWFLFSILVSGLDGSRSFLLVRLGLDLY